MNNYYLNVKSNILILTLIILISMSLIYIEITKISLFFLITYIVVGNAKRIYSERFIILSYLLRRTTYIIPLFLPILFLEDFKLIVGTKMIWYIIGVVVALGFIFVNYNTWRLILHYDYISLFKRKRKIDYFTMPFVLIFSAIGEEIFFRFYIISNLREDNLSLSIILSTLLFFLYHYSTPWSEGFTRNDFLNQLLFGLISAFLFILSGSIFPSILMHLIFNLPHILQNIRSYKFNYVINKRK